MFGKAAPGQGFLEKFTMTKQLFLLLFSIGLAGCHSSSTSVDNLEATESYYESIKYTQPDQLQNFLTAMPKGADLHNHVAGATYAENLITYTLGQGFCIDTILFSTQPGYSFVPGNSLWADNGAYQTVNSNCTADYAARVIPGVACQAFLDANEKAQLEWNLEQKYFIFEAQYSSW